MVCSLLYMWIARVPHAPWGSRDVLPLLLVRGFGGFFGGMFDILFQDRGTDKYSVGAVLYVRRTLKTTSAPLTTPTDSLVYLALGEAIVITFLAPMVAAWVCSILIKTPFTRTQQLAGLISIVGVVLITQPFIGSKSTNPQSSLENISDRTLSDLDGNPDSTSLTASENHATSGQRAMAVGFGLIGVCGAACAYTMISWIGKRAHPLLTVNYFAMWSTFVSAAALLFIPGVSFRMPATAKEWLLMLFLGITGFTMQFLLTAALAYEKSNRVLNMVYMQVFFGLAMDKVIWGVTPNLVSLLGSSLILGSAMWVALKNDAESKETTPVERADEETGLMEQHATEDRGSEVETDLEETSEGYDYGQPGYNGPSRA